MGWFFPESDGESSPESAEAPPGFGRAKFVPAEFKKLAGPEVSRKALADAGALAAMVADGLAGAVIVAEAGMETSAE